MIIRELVPEDAAAFRELRLLGLQLHPEAFGSSYEEESQQDGTAKWCSISVALQETSMLNGAAFLFVVSGINNLPV